MKKKFLLFTFFLIFFNFFVIFSFASFDYKAPDSAITIDIFYDVNRQFLSTERTVKYLYLVCYSFNSNKKNYIYIFSDVPYSYKFNSAIGCFSFKNEFDINAMSVMAYNPDSSSFYNSPCLFSLFSDNNPGEIHYITLYTPNYVNHSVVINDSNVDNDSSDKKDEKDEKDKNIISSIKKFFHDLIEFLKNILDKIISFLKLLLEILKKILDFLLSLLEKFFKLLKDLLIYLFVPRSDFFQKNFKSLQDEISYKFNVPDFHLFDDVYVYTSDVFQDIYFNDIKIVDMSFLNNSISKIKTYTDWFFWALLALYNYNQVIFLFRSSHYFKSKS